MAKMKRFSSLSRKSIRSSRFNRKHSSLRGDELDNLSKKIIDYLNELASEQSAQVNIYLPNVTEERDGDGILRLKSTLSDLFLSVDFEKDIEFKTDEKYGSWSFLEWFKSKAPAIRKEGKEIYDELKSTGKKAYSDKLGADNMLKRAQATKEFLDSIKDFDEAIIVLGDLLIAKAELDGKSRTIVLSISPKLSKELDMNPELLKNPKYFIESNKAEVIDLAGKCCNKLDRVAD